MHTTKTLLLLCALGLAGLTGVLSQAATVETPGFLKFEYYTGMDEAAGADLTAVYDLTGWYNYPALPDMTSYTSGLDSRPVFPNDNHEHYGARITGWLTPLETADYYFFLKSDDASELWLSTDATAANLALIADQPSCCNAFTEPNPDNQVTYTTQTPIHLVAGQKYAVQVLYKEGTGGDYGQVAWRKAGDTTPAAGLPPIANTYLSCLADPGSGAVTITTPPANVSVAENTSASFTVAATVTTPYLSYTGADVAGDTAALASAYQWYKNGAAVAGATGATYTMLYAKAIDNNAKIKCQVAVPGVSVFSSEATLTVTADTTPPVVEKATSDTTFTSVVVKYSEPVTDTALTVGNYTLDQGASVTAVARVDLTTVKLTTSKLAENMVFKLTINGVKDTATVANTIALNTQVQVRSFVFVPGIVLHQKYDNVPDSTGGSTAGLFGDDRYPDNPDRRDLLARWEYPPNGAGRVAADPNRNYFDTIEGFFIPPTTGNYVFFICGADRFWLYLSTDESPANMHLIAAQPGGWTQPRNWMTGESTDVTPHRSDQYASTEWPDGNTIHLTAGKRYYMLNVHHDPSWCGADDFAATYKLESEADPKDGDLPRLTGSLVGCYLDPSVGSVTFTVQPQDVTVWQGVTAKFTAAATGTSAYGTNVFYQWQTAPKGSSTWTDIAGATAASYTTPYLVPTDDGKQFRVIASAPPISAISSVATVTVSSDSEPPTVEKVGSDITFANVLVTFSEPVNDSALAASNYSFDQGVTVNSVTRIDQVTVKLTTSKLVESKTYNLTINGVQDTAVPANTIAPNTKAQLRTLMLMAGTVLHQKYDNVDLATGSSPNGLFNDPRYPNNPDRRDLLTAWEYPADGAYRVEADPVRDYFDTIEGYFIPPTTGNYVFFICGADRFWLYLSTDESPANMHLIAAQPGGWTNPRNWITGQGDTDMTLQRSDTYAGTQWPGGNTISLTAGQRYYMLSVHYDPNWAGADDFAATFKLDTEADPLDGDEPRFTGDAIAYYIDPSGTSVTFTQQPQDASVAQGAAANFSVTATATSPYGTAAFYQWQSAAKGSSTWTDIADATAESYTTPFVTLADNGTQFRVIVSVPPISETSSVATLTVLSDTTPPVVTAGAMQDSTPGIVDIGIGFNETVDSVSGNLLANYSVSPGTITGIAWYTNRFTANSQNPSAMVVKQTALLKVTGLSGSGTLTIKDVADVFGNKMASTNVPFTVDTKMKWGVVGANETGGWNAVVPVAANGFDIYSDGIGEWGSYDEATFVYEQVTGDFDKQLRVEYQDGSSQWARAGLIVRDVLNFGVDRGTQEGGAAGKYQKCHVNPVGATLTGPGTAGNGQWETNRRLTTGAATTSIANSGVPQYPSAWCRIQRVGQDFSCYRSDDGVNWTLIGTTTFTDEPMPATVYVGPEYSPENGNVTQEADKGTFLAQIRDYGDYVTIFDPQLKIGKDAAGKVTITWSAGTLVSSSTVQGTYAPVAGATSPYAVTPAAGATMFYQVRK